MEIRHIEFKEHNRVLSQHSELAAEHPKLAYPNELNRIHAAPDFPYLFYAIEHGKIASYFGSFPDTLIYGDHRLRWAWNGNLYTEPEFRGRGVARKVVEYQLKVFAHRDIIWGGVFSSPAALRVYQRMGFSMPGNARRMCLVRDVRRFVRHHTSNPLAISASGLMFDAAFATAKILLLHPWRLRRRYCIERIEGAEFSALLEKRSLLRPEKFFWGCDARWFEVRRQARAVDSIYLVRRRGEIDPAVFLIVRDRMMQTHPLMGKYLGVQVMSIMEFGQFDLSSDIPSVLIGASIMLFLKSNADLIEFVTSSPEIERTARRYGFVPIGQGMSFKFMAPPGNPFHGLRTKLSDWHLSHYCGDAYGFE